MHSLPGRIRLRNAMIRNNPGAVSRLGTALSIHPHVKKFRCTVLRGTVLVFYDPRRVRPRELVSYLESRLQSVPCDGDVDVDDRGDLDTLIAALTFSQTLRTLFPGCTALSYYFILKSARPIFERGITAIRAGVIKVDILDMLAILFCLAKRREGAAAFMIACVHLCSHLLERTRRRSERLLTSAFERRAQSATVLSDGKPRRVPVDSLAVDDIILLDAGDQAPIDGEVVAGAAMVDRHVLTGESAPVEVGPGDKVLASAVVFTGSLAVRVERTGRETAAQRIVEIITRASRLKTKTQSLGEKLADSAVLPTIALSLLALSRTRPDSALAIMNADYGTGIRIAAPIALLSYLACAARRGILIKDGSVLEALGDVGTFVFDKTGTVTLDTPEVVGVTSRHEGFPASDIVGYAAAAEQRFSHPIAAAINKEAHRLGLVVPESSEPHYRIGWGVQVVVNGQTVKIGGKRFMDKEAIEISLPAIEETDRSEGSGGMVIFVAIDDVLVGSIELRSRIRSEIFEIVNELKRNGHQVVLLSGDSDRATKAVASRLGIDRYYAEVLPEEKGRTIENMQAHGERVAMIGDGINDAIALSKANVSMSLNGAADIANDAADVIFMDGDLSKFLCLLDISGQLTRNVTRTFKLIVIANSICILGALFDKVSLRSAVILNNLFNLAGALNGLSPLYPRISERWNGRTPTRAGSARSVAEHRLPHPARRPMARSHQPNDNRGEAVAPVR